MPRVSGVLVVGLDAAVVDHVRRRLPAVDVLAVPAALGTQAVNRLEAAVVVVDGAAGEAGEVVDAAQRDVRRPPRVVWCLDAGPGGEVPAGLVARYAIDRLLFRPLDPEEVARQVAVLLGVRLADAAADAAATASARAASAVADIWARSRETIIARIDVMEEVLAALLEDRLDEDIRRTGMSEAHKLAGAAGTFGFPRASQLARTFEMALAPGAELDVSRVPELAEVADALRRELDGPPVLGSSASPAPSDDRPLLLVVAPTGSGVALEAAQRGLRVVSVTDVDQARTAAGQERPHASLVDLSLPGALDLVAAFDASPAAFPVVVIGDAAGRSGRVEAARVGARGYSDPDAAPAELLDVVGRVLSRDAEEAPKILAVDDDPDVLAALGAVLRPAGYQVTTLTDPLAFWSTLTETSPDLLILDIELPRVSGLELCRMVRNDARWVTVPVLLLTAATEADSAERVFAAGGDDYVSKPILGPELVTRVGNRLERVRLYRSLSEIDALTGVVLRQRSEHTIGAFLSLAARTGSPLSLGVVDVDDLRRVNLDHGHALGDTVLRRVGALLRRQFRGEDVVARWGGEEFVVAMYGMPTHDGLARLAEVVEAVRDERFAANDGSTVSVTVSVGVVEHRGDGDLKGLYRGASEALRLAKSRGGDRVATTPDEAGGPAADVDVLLVEDDEVLAGLLAHALSTRGYRSLRLSDGQEAMGRLTDPVRPLRPRVALLDVDLPGLDGLTLLRQAARDGLLRQTRVIMLTARSSESEILEALETGAFDHVAKPFSVPVLMQRVRRAMAS